MQRDRIVVAGGGIGGLAAALALANNGFAVTVLERAARFEEIAAWKSAHAAITFEAR